MADVPLGPGVTNEQRDEIMERVIHAFNIFEGDLAGTFYPLDCMNEESQMFIDDHSLLKVNDPFREACGLHRNWPRGRGIFINNKKTFAVCVNEEDHLKLISIQPGADIGAVFDRLSRAAKAIETVARFSHTDHLGYITSCPTNLGTALRASVRINLPKLMED